MRNIVAEKPCRISKRPQITKIAAGYYVFDAGAYIIADEYQADVHKTIRAERPCGPIVEVA